MWNLYILPIIYILYAAHICGKWLNDDGYEGQPKHVGVKGIVVQCLVKIKKKLICKADENIPFH
jgi:hypothetical protein